MNISGITVVVQNQGTQQQNNGTAVDAAYRQVIEMYVRKGIQQETKDGGIIAVCYQTERLAQTGNNIIVESKGSRLWAFLRLGIYVTRNI